MKLVHIVVQDVLYKDGYRVNPYNMASFSAESSTQLLQDGTEFILSVLIFGPGLFA